MQYSFTFGFADLNNALHLTEALNSAANIGKKIYYKLKVRHLNEPLAPCSKKPRV